MDGTVYKELTAAFLSGVVACGLVISVPQQADAVSIVKYKNCKAMNAKYKHGVGKKGARDVSKSGRKTTTKFYRNTSLYNALYKKNKGFDRDRDGVACEKP